mgnify:CR=1 FL=1
MLGGDAGVQQPAELGGMEQHARAVQLGCAKEEMRKCNIEKNTKARLSGHKKSLLCFF